MVRNYKRKTTRGAATGEEIQAALKFWRDGTTLPQTSAAATSQKRL